MKAIFSRIFLILVLASVIISCSLNQLTGPQQSPTSSARIGFKPGDATSTPPGSEIADADFQAAVQAYRARDFETVLKLMEPIVAKDPQLAPSHWYLGRAYYESGNFEAALDQMEKALAIDPYYALAYADRGLIKITLGYESDGLTDYQRALEIDPSLAKVHHNLGAFYSTHNDQERAFQEFDLAVQIDPTRTVTWNARSNTLYALGRYEDCIQSANTAFELNNQNWLSYAFRGLCHSKLGEIEYAIFDISLALESNPNDPAIIFQACYLYVNIEHNDQAIEFCTRSIALNPNGYESLINRGVAYFNMEKYPEALNDFNAALKFGEIPAAYSDRGNVYMKMSQYEEAVTDYKRSLALYPNGNVYYSLGLTYIQSEDYQSALSAFEQGDALEPERTYERTRLWRKAQAYDKMGQIDEALDLYTELIDRYQYIEAYYYRGRIYEERSMKPKAVQDYQMFLVLAKEMPDHATIQMLASDAETRIEELGK